MSQISSLLDYVKNISEEKPFYPLLICDQPYSDYFDQNSPHTHQFNAEQVFTFGPSYIKLLTKYQI